jgi:hypothetical protein
METAGALLLVTAMWLSIGLSIAYVLWHRGYRSNSIAAAVGLAAVVLGPAALVLLLLPSRR